MARRYKFLYGRLQQLGLTQADVAEMLGVQQAAVSHRFTGRTEWTLTEMYQLMDICQAPADELHIYFPRDGKDNISAGPKNGRVVSFPRKGKEVSA